MADFGIPRQLELFPPASTGAEPASEEIATPTLPKLEVPAHPDSDTLPCSRRLTSLARELAAGLGLSKLARRVYVEWNLRMRTAAGRAHYRDNRIELNPALLKLPGVDGTAEMDRTLRHELAHLVAHTRAKGRRIQPHGPEWKKACTDLGIPDESRCHTLPFEPRRVKRKFLYECPTCKSHVPRVRKFRRPVACYACCKQHSGGRYDSRFRLEQVPGENESNEQVAANAAAD
ncbi:MAG: hypothetical protein HKN23_21500 [Verrucomicrobiales bacterium]|nr:hypothetical protein [Verrucomicrobiales bacterium]